MEKITRKPRGRPRSFDRDEALQRALTIFRERGFEGASIAELCAATELNPPSLYAAFGDKRRLWTEALDRYQSEQGAFAARALLEEDARAAVARMLREAAALLTSPDGPKGCVVVIGALTCTDDSAGKEAAKRRAASFAALSERLHRAVREGELPPGTDPDALARYFVTVFQGMSIQARDGASCTDLEQVAERAMAAWPAA